MSIRIYMTAFSMFVASLFGRAWSDAKGKGH